MRKKIIQPLQFQNPNLIQSTSYLASKTFSPTNISTQSMAASSSTSDDILTYKDSYHLPVLYKKNAHGKEIVWKIYTLDNQVFRSSGRVDGKITEHKPRTFTGKNKGKKNETTDVQQAQIVADREWVKQLDKGYRPKSHEGIEMLNKVMETKSKTGGTNINSAAAIRGGKVKNVKKTDNFKVGYQEVEIKPMKAPSEPWKFNTDNVRSSGFLARKLKYVDFTKGVYLQWKLDGYRCVARVQRNQQDPNKLDTLLTSNTSKEFPWFEHLRKQVQLFIQGNEHLIYDGLDCEVYCHHLHNEQGVDLCGTQEHFQLVQRIGAMSRKQPHPLENQMCLYVFDLVDTTEQSTFEERYSNLCKLFDQKPGGCTHIVPVYTKKIKIASTDNIQEINKMGSKVLLNTFDEFLEQGYEGIMIRAHDLPYRCGRRVQKLAKFKPFIDTEYKIVGAKCDPGVSHEHFTWIMTDESIIDPDTDKPIVFSGGNKGFSCEENIDLYDNYFEYIGKLATVRFQEFTSKGIPRFPKVTRIRDQGFDL